MCRATLNAFFSTMSAASQTQVGGAFATLGTFSETPEAAVCASPATFIQPTAGPKFRSDVVMPDVAASWGFSKLRHFTQQEMDELGQTALEQVLDMLKHGHLVGVDSRLPRILQRGGIHAAKYMVDWRREGVLLITLSKDLLDNRYYVPASNRVLRIPLQKHTVRQGMCQDNQTTEPPECQDDNVAKVFYHGTPLLTVPAILAFGLNASVRSHTYVGLWCREKVEEALTWCICPAVQHFPCVALELAAWTNTQCPGGEHGELINTSKTHGAICTRAQCEREASVSDRLPPVTLRALWVAMPRSHLHFQQVSHLHDVFKQTIDWVAKATGVNLHRAGRRDGDKSGMLTGYVSQLTERRLAYGGLAGQDVNLPDVSRRHQNKAAGVIVLSLDCARCMRVAEGDTTGECWWPWGSVPGPFRHSGIRGRNGWMLVTLSAEPAPM